VQYGVGRPGRWATKLATIRPARVRTVSFPPRRGDSREAAGAVTSTAATSFSLQDHLTVARSESVRTAHLPYGTPISHQPGPPIPSGCGGHWTSSLNRNPSSVFLPLRPYRPLPRERRSPFVQGWPDAVVVGPGRRRDFTLQITDKYGRVKVPVFSLGTGGKKKRTRTASCLGGIRVSAPPWPDQSWCPPSSIRESDEEVIVDFLEGDPGPADHRVGARLQHKRRQIASISYAGRRHGQRPSNRTKHQGRPGWNNEILAE